MIQTDKLNSRVCDRSEWMITFFVQFAKHIYDGYCWWFRL